MKTNLILFIVCLLLNGCQNGATVPVQPALPPKGKVSDLVLVEEFLRAAYCADRTSYKIKADPDFESYRKIFWADSNLDDQLTQITRKGMEEGIKTTLAVLLREQPTGFWIVLIDPKHPNQPSDFYCEFDRVRGQLKIFETKPDQYPYTGGQIVFQNWKEVELGQTFIMYGLCFQIDQKEKLFRALFPLPVY